MIGVALHITRSAFAPDAPGRRACEAATLLGMTLDGPPRVPRPCEIEMTLLPGTITLIEGPSGSGKSRLLADIRRAGVARGWRVIDVEADIAIAPDRACVELFDGGVERAMRLLALAGLGEGGVYVRRAGMLSAGQMARLRLAVAMAEAERATPDGKRVLVLVDELGSGLDAHTARAVAMLLRRWAGPGSEVSVIAATVRDDLADALGPDVTLALDLWGNVRPSRPAARGDQPVFRVERGSLADYRSLAPLHYRAGAPATAAGVWRAIGDDGMLAGVLVVSMPTLNAQWRRSAWGLSFASPDRGVNARRINRDLRCISRVIVDPRWRGMGAATRLVRHYLDDPLTPCTEAVAAMGSSSHFFVSAGMQEIAIQTPLRDRRLLEVLEHAGVERWRLAMPTWVAEHTRACGEVEQELRRWARASRATSRHAGDGFGELMGRACRGLAAERRAYVHGRLTFTGREMKGAA